MCAAERGEDATGGGVRVWGWGLGFGVWGLGFEVWALPVSEATRMNSDDDKKAGDLRTVGEAWGAYSIFETALVRNSKSLFIF